MESDDSSGNHLRMACETWDWNDRAPTKKIVQKIKLVGGEQFIIDDIDTGADYYAAVISNREITEEEALKYFRHALYSPDEIDEGSSVDDICAKIRHAAMAHDSSLTPGDFGENE